MNKQGKLFYALFAILLSNMAYAEGKFSGLMFGDYYWFAGHSDGVSVAGQKGFWIRRIYFTYDYKFEEAWSSRLRFETSTPDFKSSATQMTPFIKDAYLQWKGEANKAFFGLSGTPTLELVEGHWGFRPVEKSPEDLWWKGAVASRDFGVGIKGSYADGLFGYHLMFGNGSGDKSETNRNGKAYLSLTTVPIKALLFEFYVDYETGPNSMVSHFFAGYKTDSFRAGGLFSHLKKNNDKGGFYAMNLASLYGAYTVSDTLSVYARMDKLGAKLDEAKLSANSYLLPSTKDKPTLMIAGVDYELARNVHVMPNIELVSYADGLDSNVIPRLTFSWVF